MMIYDDTIEHKLTRVYVALAMTREVARRSIVDNETFNLMLSLIEVAFQTLEELLDNTSTTNLGSPMETQELEMLM